MKRLSPSQGNISAKNSFQLIKSKIMKTIRINNKHGEGDSLALILISTCRQGGGGHFVQGPDLRRTRPSHKHAIGFLITSVVLKQNRRDKNKTLCTQLISLL